MCTALTFKTESFYFGRNLDNMESYGEEVVVTPRRFPLRFRREKTLAEHHAIIGTATVMDGVPLYYDAVNEKGLCAAGLNFVGNAAYFKPAEGCRNIAHFEVISWLLGKCANLNEARCELERMNIVDDAFSDAAPAASLHWMIADRTGALTVESTSDGLHVYENRPGVLTNNPQFPVQLAGLDRYMSLSPEDPQNTFAPELALSPQSRGTGALGMPGDLSSESRFVRAVFTKAHSVCGGGEGESVGQFFHILDAVAFTEGSCHAGGGKYEKTIYSSCCNTDRGIYYFTTYGNRGIRAVDMGREDLNGDELSRYAMGQEEAISFIN